MKIDPTTGLLDQGRYVESPNHNVRPDESDITLLVVHCISLPRGEYGGDEVEALFTNRLDPDAHPTFRDLEGLKVSSHIFIRRDGEVVQFVPFHKRAWHAGVSSFEGREGCNDFSIGIELEGTDDSAYESVQYGTLATLSAELMRVYPGITRQRIAGHCDIAPTRKTDPGTGFDWDRFHELLTQSIIGSEE